MNAKEEKKPKFKLPRYLKLDKGSMWFDTEGENSSGVRIFATNKKFVGRGKEEYKSGEIVKDKFNNKNILEYGYVDESLPWYIDTKEIPFEKLSRIILAYRNRILVEANPDKPPCEFKREDNREFKLKDNGDRIFVGKNKAMFKTLMNSNDKDLKKFIVECPATNKGRENLMDLRDLELRGHNRTSRTRIEVLNWIKEKLNAFGPGMSPIRINEDDE